LEILVDGLENRDIIDDCEIYFIWYMRSYVPHGYNVELGGLRGVLSDHARAERLNDKDRSKKYSAMMRELNSNDDFTKKRKDGLARRNMDEEWRKRHIERISKLTKTDKWQNSHKRVLEFVNSSPEIQEKRKARHREVMQKVVFCETDGTFYESLKKTCSIYKIDMSSLIRVMKGDFKKIKGNVFRYATEGETVAFKLRKKQVQTDKSVEGL